MAENAPARPPDEDRDQDQIPDAADKCPADPETSNGYQDDDGCPDLAPVVAAPASGGPPEIVERIYFEASRQEVKPTSFPVLDAIALVLKMQPDLFPLIALEGHAAVNETNGMRLSLARASTVRNALVERGVDGNRLLARASGATVPVCGEQVESCWRRARRVEFAILRSAKPTEEGAATGAPAADGERAADRRDKAAESRPRAPETLDQVAFGNGSAVLGPSALPTLDLIAGFLKSNPSSVEVEGHAAANEPRPAELARARAEAVRAYLVACGVNSDNVVTRAQGSQKPLCKQKTGVCRARNRRAELRFP